MPVLRLPDGWLLIGHIRLYSNCCRSARFQSHSKFNFKTSQCFVIATRAVQQRDQPATAGADVSFPDGLRQHRRWSDRDFFLLINMIASANLFLRVSVGQLLLLQERALSWTQACPAPQGWCLGSQTTGVSYE